MGAAIGFVDVGFVRASVADLIGQPTAQVRLAATAVHALMTRVATAGNTELLRTYWYDGQFDPASPRYASQRRYFDAVGRVPGVHLRLGALVERIPAWHRDLRAALEAHGLDPAEFARTFPMGPELVQKGVDSLLTLDLVTLAAHRTYRTAIVVTGDRDIAPALEVAQAIGVRVVLLVMPGKVPSAALVQAADQIVGLTERDVLALTGAATALT